MKDHVLGALRVCAASIVACCVAYPLLVLGAAQLLVPRSADGSLVTDVDGHVRGSSLVAQKFEGPEWLWPRPSAVDYDAAGAGGSNLSPRSPRITERAQGLLRRLEATPERPAPAELVTASGGGLDPHVTLRGALYQAPRIARARKLELGTVEGLLRARASSPAWGLGGEPLVNVLEVNLALQELGPGP